MASQVSVTWTCDMALHADKPVEAVEREVLMQVGDVVIEVDLCVRCMKELAGKFAPYMEAGKPVSRRDPRRGGRAATKPRSSGSGNYRNGQGSTRPSEIREWARSQGMSLSTRGRIPEEVQAAYKAAVGT